MLKDKFLVRESIKQNELSKTNIAEKISSGSLYIQKLQNWF